MTATTLFRPAEVTSAFLKMGLLGFQGSGKTKTAIGLVKQLKNRGIPYANKLVHGGGNREPNDDLEFHAG